MNKKYLFIWCGVIFIFLYNFYLPYVVKILYLHIPLAVGSDNYLLYYDVGKAFNLGLSPYIANGEPTWLFYPPTFLPIYGLIARLGLEVGGHVWRAIGIILFLLTSLTFIKFCYPDRKLNVFLIFCSVSLLSKPMVHNFVHSQIELVSASLILLSFLFYVKEKKIISAVCLALGIHWKLSPGFFILFFLLKREWKVIIYTMISTLIIGILAYLYVPHQVYVEYYFSIIPYIYNLYPKLLIFPNQSIFALFHNSKILVICYFIVVFGMLWHINRKRTFEGCKQGVSPCLYYNLLLFTMVILFAVQLPSLVWSPIYTWTIIPCTFLVDSILKGTLNGKIKYAIMVGITLMLTGVIDLPVLKNINLLGGITTLISLIYQELRHSNSGV